MFETKSKNYTYSTEMYVQKPFESNRSPIIPRQTPNSAMSEQAGIPNAGPGSDSSNTSSPQTEQSHYSLRWNNHQTHLLRAFGALRQADALVDVSLVCAEGSVRAHKVVLSACSPFFQRLFAETPCEHPVVVLNDFHGWELRAIVDFMYRGEISVGQHQLPALIKAAESLQVRGLAHQDSTGTTSAIPVPEESPSPPLEEIKDEINERDTQTPPPKLPHMPHLNFSETLPASNTPSNADAPLCGSPLPRRKQARPRRRSGELAYCPQDLSNKQPPEAHQQSTGSPVVPPQDEDTAEDLCVKRDSRCSPPPPGPALLPSIQNLPPALQPPPPPPIHHQGLFHVRESPEPKSPYDKMDLSKDYTPSPPVKEYLPPAPHAFGVLGAPSDTHSPLPFSPISSVSALAMTPPHNIHDSTFYHGFREPAHRSQIPFFGLDSPLALFPPGLDGCRNPLLDMADPRGPPDAQIFSKKKMGRPKGQHSAPRGGPPRSWTNAELTEALQHVWNKKMTTSQASRIFGIPYNSLLMYVRGKYGKSLKLEQLRKDCTGGGTAEELALALGPTNNNNHHPHSGVKTDPGAPPPPPPPGVDLGHPKRPPSTESHDMMPSPVFNPFAHNFYTDFGSSFPIPVSMIHLLPQSEKNHENSYLSQLKGEDDSKSDRSKEHSADEETDIFRTPVLSRDERRELIQQNGQD